MKRYLLVTICGVGLLFAGCGDDSGPTNPGNLPPAITGPESVEATVGVSVNFDVVATDPDGDALDLTVSAVVTLADWRAGIRAGEVTVDPENGRVTFTPNANDDPQRTLVITAEDGSGAKASLDVLVLVSGPPVK